MGFFDKKLRELERKADAVDKSNLTKETSDKAVDLIKELSGKSGGAKKKIIDNIIVMTNPAAGGTGVSTITHNVAYEAYKRGFKVLIVDLDICYPIQHSYLGIVQEIEKPDLVSYLLGKNTLGESINNSSRISLLYANNRTLQDELKCNEKVAIENFIDMINKVRQLYDLVLIDCPMKIDSLLQNTAFYICDQIYCVWNEGIDSLVNTDKMRRNMAISGIDSYSKMRIILNKRTSIHFSDYSLNKLNLELVEVLPFTPDLIDNSLRGRIFCEEGQSTQKNSGEFVRKIQSLTDKMLKIGGYIE